MSRQTRIAARALAAGLLTVALFFGWRAAQRGRPAPPAPAPAPTLRFAWAPGTEYVYDVDLASRQRAVSVASPTSSPVEGRLRVRGEVAVRCYEAQNGHFVLGLDARSLREATLKLGPAEDPAVRDGLAGKEIYFDVDAVGHVASLRFRRDLPETVKGALSALALSMAVTLPEGAAQLWEADEPTLLGTARSLYRRDGGPSGEAFTREHASYATLLGVPSAGDAARALVSSEDDVTFDAREGIVRELHVHEQLGVPAAGGEASFAADVTFRLHFVGRAPFAAPLPELAALESRMPGAPPSRDPQAGLAQLAGSLTLAQIDSTIAAFGMGVALPAGFVTSATALLQLHPELAAGLVEIFEREPGASSSRALVVDLLSSAGHAEAQRAMCDALASPVARRDPKELGGLMQRFALLASPTRESIDFVYREYDRPLAKDTRAAAAHALGSEIGNAARSADPSRVVAMNGRLQKDLDRARGADEKVTLLAAMGNAGLGGNVATVRRFARDTSAQVRAQAAFALRKTDDAGARDTLADLVADTESAVEIAALDTLAQMPPSHASTLRVASFARSGTYAGEIAEALVTFAGEERGDPAAVEILEALTRRAGDARTRSRAQIVLDQIRR